MVTISVVMPVYNTPVPFLKEAVESILNQTFGDFEFIIIDDGSTNDAKEYLDGLTDPRIRLIRNETNIGITKSLNIGFKAAQGKYIARMDSDDISFPERFEKQYAFMEAHPEVIVCGASTERCGEKEGTARNSIYDMDYYRVLMLFKNPGPAHSTAFLNRDLLVHHHILYNEKLVYAQDYGLWAEVSKYGNIVILDDILLRFRFHPQRISSLHRKQQIQCDQMTQRVLLEKLLGPITDAELNMHYIHSTGWYPDATMNMEIAKWYRRIINANKTKHIYDQKQLERQIERIEKRLLQNMCAREKSGIKRKMFYMLYYPILPEAIRKVKTKLLKTKLVSMCKNRKQ